MSKGTASGLLNTQKAQSIFKHEILRSYVLPFIVMPAKKIKSRRACLVDGYAGQGRYEDGSAASAEHLLVAAQKSKTSASVGVFLVERSRQHFNRLQSVVDEYRQHGIDVVARKGEVQDFIEPIVQWANNASLFLFLDPCGANLPFETVRYVLGTKRTDRWPPTEALLNINADLTRRAAGAVKKGMLDNEAVSVLDAVCGGQWWQDTALDARESSETDTWESAAEAVVNEYARRLGDACGMKSAVAPVRRRTHQQPVYHLVFFTRSNHGLWVFGDIAAKARHEWLDFVGPNDDDDGLFGLIQHQIDSEAERARPIIKGNLERIAQAGVRTKLVDRATDVFGETYGMAREGVVRKAMREIQKSGTVPVDTSLKHVRDWSIG